VERNSKKDGTYVRILGGRMNSDKSLTDEIDFASSKTTRAGSGHIDIESYRQRKPYGSYSLDLILNSLPRDKQGLLLDCGCGSGLYTIWISKQRDIRSIGVDVSIKRVMIAKKSSEASGLDNFYLVADIEKLPFKEETFDFVTLLASLHHSDPDKTMEEVRRVIDNDSLVVLFEPNRHNPLKWITTYSPLRFIFLPFISRFRSKNETDFSKKELEVILKKQGFVFKFSYRFDISPYILNRFCKTKTSVRIISTLQSILQRISVLNLFAYYFLINATPIEPDLKKRIQS